MALSCFCPITVMNLEKQNILLLQIVQFLVCRSSIIPQKKRLKENYGKYKGKFQGSKKKGNDIKEPATKMAST
jgi:hypothetical protein